jgi:hypothetical protein
MNFRTESDDIPGRGQHQSAAHGHEISISLREPQLAHV